MNFSEAMFYENYLTSDFHTNTVISRRVCLLVKKASKTVIRPILLKALPVAIGIVPSRMLIQERPVDCRSKLQNKTCKTFMSDPS